MKERRDTSSADLTDEFVVKKKRTKRPPLWHRIIYDDAMVALVRLLGHEGILRSELPDKAKPLIEKFGRERLQEVADEIVETVGNGDDEIARLTEQARKLAIQLIGRPRLENTNQNSPVAPEQPNPAATPVTSSAPQTAMEIPVEPLTPSTDISLEFDSLEWANCETSCVAKFLSHDRDFLDECRSLARRCCQQSAQCESVKTGVHTKAQTRTRRLAEELQSLVCDQNPLAEEQLSPFTALLEIALENVDWPQIADSFLQRLTDQPDAD